jgi:hypothetical protein
MKHTYQVAAGHNTLITCGHEHRTAEAAERCRLRNSDSVRLYPAVLLKDGLRSNGVGLWSDGEPNPHGTIN